MRAIGFILGALLLVAGLAGFITFTDQLAQARTALKEAEFALEQTALAAQKLLDAAKAPPSQGGLWGLIGGLIDNVLRSGQYKQLQQQAAALQQQAAQLEQQIAQIHQAMTKLALLRGLSAGMGVLGLGLLAGALLYPRQEVRVPARYIEDRRQPRLRGPSDRPQLPSH